jgi:hypothetical protein
MILLSKVNDSEKIGDFRPDKAKLEIYPCLFVNLPDSEVYFPTTSDTRGERYSFYRATCNLHSRSNYVMIKIYLTILVILSATIAWGQKYMTRTGKIQFSASVPGSPEVEATNNESGAVLDAKSGDLVFQVPIKSFKFKKDLMQTHFNENYMESSKYPRAEFRGKIAGGGMDLSKDGSYNTNVTGKLTIHGITHDVSVPGTITVKARTVALNAKFSVAVKDYNINIPGVVADKVAKEATIIVESVLTKQ